ncbi:pre-peptidase C-terminal domain-containing protein [Thalassomonas viridans]|uniref:pre-peptidase C-terminal domain-containing protein n=1 Tax=Thalassomonas viridans TaxID=137584 RepID=UPI00069F708F|nr:pre-peptidase C-terminal domain-containing protein [Thalassomonas viridans]
MYKYVLALLVFSGLSPAANADTVKKTAAPVTIIAETVEQKFALSPEKSLSLAGSNGREYQIKIKKAGADFIKVHFSHFNIPAGASVAVTDAAGKERYVYDGVARNQATFDSAVENGVNQFSAMSVFGDTALVTLSLAPGSKWQAHHQVNIDRFNAGFGSGDVNHTLGGEQNLSGDIGIESTCGVNERRDVACWEDSNPVEFERTRPVARLLMSGSGLCTGWRVGDDNLMFTNEHCVGSQSELTNTEVWFNYQKTTCGGSEFAGTVKVTGNTLLKSDYELDYTLFSVNDFQSISGFGNFGLDVRTPTLSERIYIAQHGSGNPKELAIESDSNASGLCEIDLAVANGRGTGTDTGYFCDTIGGSSGSPVLAAASNKVIALHHFGGCENQGVRIDQIWPQVSSYFNDVPPLGDNNSGGNQPPVAVITYTCDALVCDFDGSGSVDVDGSITSYNWWVDDVAVSSNATMQHTFAATGNYTVSLQVTDNEGVQRRRDISVNVSDGLPGELQSGVPVTGLTAAKDGELDFFIDVSGNNNKVVINMSGGSGDADLYVKSGSAPTKSDYDCRPYLSGNNESCTITMSSAGRVYIKVIGYSAFSGASLVATINTDIPDDFPKTDLSATQGNWIYDEYPVPGGVSQIAVSISGGSGDADLYIRKGQQPTTSDYICRPYLNGNNESCTVDITDSQAIHIGIRAYSSFSGVTLDVN